MGGYKVTLRSYNYFSGFAFNFFGKSDFSNYVQNTRNLGVSEIEISCSFIHRKYFSE
jgi:hypothetical protein